MKYLLLLPYLYFIIFGSINAQHSHDKADLDIMATVINSESVDSIAVKLSVMRNSDNELEIHSEQSQSGKMVLTGTPYSKISIRVPSETILRDPTGKAISLSDIQLLAGTSNDLSSMEVLTPADCNELSVPESGQFFIRMGAKVSGDSPINGTYFGSLNFECGTPER